MQNNISSAYELFADLGKQERRSRKRASEPEAASNPGVKASDSVERNSDNERGKGEAETMAERFKKTFSRPDVKVHFVGAWCISAFLVKSSR
jgi:hypothetical protein